MAGRHAVLEAGVEAAALGQADWCRSCDRLRYRGDMRWLVDLYACRACLGEGVGTPALWIDPWDDDTSAAALIPIFASVPLVKGAALDLRKDEAEAREMLTAYGL
ncbi:membrane protein [Mycobacterium phage Indlovu]|nr:membrane protein [Mycobacterium phage Indlovu]